MRGIDFEKKNATPAHDFQLKTHSQEHEPHISGPQIVLNKCDDSSDFDYEFKLNGDNMVVFRKCIVFDKNPIDESLPEPDTSDSGEDASG
jgi:hypothetical protein